MSRRTSIGLFAFVAVAWGGSYPAIEIGLRSVSPVFYAAIRLLVAAAVGLPVAALFVDDWIPRTTDDRRYVLVTGLFVGALANGFLFVGQQYATSGQGAVFVGLNPVLAAGFSSVLLPATDLSAVEALGVLFGIAGVTLVGNPDLTSLGSLGGQYVLVLTAASLALGSVLSERLDPTISPVAGNGWAMGVGGLLLLAGSGALGGPVVVSRITPSVVAAALYIGVVATAGGYGAYFALLSRVGAVRTNLVSYVVPLVATVSGLVLLGQPVTLRLLGGFALIAAGFAAVNRRELAAMVDSARDARS
ncbi:MAG: DMT family transporter [Haloarculaceae archaeon]